MNTAIIIISVVCSYASVGILGYIIGTIRTQEQMLSAFARGLSDGGCPTEYVDLMTERPITQSVSEMCGERTVEQRDRLQMLRTNGAKVVPLHPKAD